MKIFLNTVMILYIYADDNASARGRENSLKILILSYSSRYGIFSDFTPN